MAMALNRSPLLSRYEVDLTAVIRAEGGDTDANHSGDVVFRSTLLARDVLPNTTTRETRVRNETTDDD
jgi:hypothetical protein